MDLTEKIPVVVRRHLKISGSSLKNMFYVDYTPNNSNQPIECSCRRMIRKGLPCKHILYVFKMLKFDELPECLVLRRFSKQARGGLPASRTSDLFGWAFSGAEERTRYTELSVLRLKLYMWHATWYVSNVSIIFDAPCLFLYYLSCVSLHFAAFLCDFRN
jgi:hypothetical protein